MKRIDPLARLALMSSAMACVLIIALTIRKQQPIGMTLGALSSKTTQFTPQSIRVTNCIGGKQTGRFYVFPSPATSRHTVVFALDTGDVIGSNQTILCGHFDGTCTFSLPDCPAAPPFLLVTGVRPE